MDALNYMVERDFSQLPVVDENNRLVGLVTSDSIVRALDNFQLSTNELPLNDAIIPIVDVERETYRLSDDLFLLLERLRSTDAIIIVDENKAPVRIVTNADMAEWLRRRAQDSIVVGDIESKLKQYIPYAFYDANGHLDEAWS